MHTTPPPDLKTFRGRLKPRLLELGVPVVELGADGDTRLIEPAQQIHELIVGSPLFTAAVRSNHDTLAREPVEVCELWPGLSLVPARSTLDGGPGDTTHSNGGLLAALVVSNDVLDSEQFVSICNHTGMDLASTRSRLKNEPLMSAEHAAQTARVIAWMVRDMHDLGWRLRELHDLSWDLARSYEELGLMYKLSTNMIVDHPPKTFLNEMCREMREVVGLRWLAIQPALNEPSFAGLPVTVSTDKHTPIDPANISAVGPALLDAMHGRRSPVIVDDAGRLNIPGLDAIASSLLITPLHADGRTVGLMYGADKLHHDGGLNTADSKLCASLGSSLSIYLKNYLLFEDQHAMFLGTMHALSRTIDAKDPYTQGHSERVALLARQLARAAGLDDQMVDRVYLSALVHDVGKIGVPEAALTKPGKLTREEYELIKKHPEIGARIIERIRQMKDLIPGVLHHHESWDGSGYPRGLAKRDIPLFGRVIGLADAFDAMSSNRTYRDAMPMHKALDEVRRCSGKQFDPELVDVFVAMDFNAYLDALKTRSGRVNESCADGRAEAEARP